MSSEATFILPPINAGDVFTCQGNGLLFEGIPRLSIEELRELLKDGSGQVIAGNRKEPKQWFQSQCAHYGLPTKGTVAGLRTQLETFLASDTACIPEAIRNLEVEKNAEYKAFNEKIKNMTSRARSPTPGRARRVTMAHTLSDERIPSPDEPSPDKVPRSRTISAGASQPPTQREEPQPGTTKRGRGRPRKSESAKASDQGNVQSTKPKPGSSRENESTAARPSLRGVPISQDSITSVYSELDDQVMEVLDEIENGIDMMENDNDGDSQMIPPPSPPRNPAVPPEPQTPKRSHIATASSPLSHSPRSTLERDVVSGFWSIHVVGTGAQTTRPASDLQGTMNLSLAEDKRSLSGEFSLLGMDGALQSRTLEGRIDGAYARLSFVGQVARDSTQAGEPANQVFGPSLSQTGYLRISDGRKGSDGRFTLKGSFTGGSYSKVDFEGVREGTEKPFCIKWDDFTD